MTSDDMDEGQQDSSTGAGPEDRAPDARHMPEDGEIAAIGSSLATPWVILASIAVISAAGLMGVRLFSDPGWAVLTWIAVWIGLTLVGSIAALAGIHVALRRQIRLPVLKEDGTLYCPLSRETIRHGDDDWDFFLPFAEKESGGKVAILHDDGLLSIPSSQGGRTTATIRYLKPDGNSRDEWEEWLDRAFDEAGRSVDAEAVKRRFPRRS